ncbi:MAG: GH39 [uncultured Rubrobacteraceae bacterium]|uniref:GH39 n=1 Tax=uncultured Rubrobacteraceae bacterium TaxID=349277 RepID=A0A6J4SBM5_9ACTN|nr:MAG: GH39 [uncultured Rubrobacteraceae bacterium]
MCLEGESMPRIEQSSGPPPFTPASEPATPRIASARVAVDCADARGPVERIWTSVGYDELNWTYTPSGERALGVIGAVAERPYHVRTHYIFNSGIGWSLPHWGAGNVYHEDANGEPYYDFTIADRLYDAIVGAGHVPLVELAFTPRALVPDDARERFAYTPSPTLPGEYEAGHWSFPPKDYRKWGGLVRALVAHCAERYGPERVRGWLWELWNEPDIFYWRGTPQEYYALYDVTANAVLSALPGARVGGPATTGDLLGNGPAFLRGFLGHCERAGTPLHFVSFHTKGAHFRPWRVYGPVGAEAPEKQSPSSLKMLREVRTGLEIVAEHARYRDLPCVVDECDASVPAHWGAYDNANYGYRNTEYFAVFQCKLMKKLLDLNDACGARVHQATTWSFYFEGERFFEGTRSLFTAGLVQKPVLNAYRMLARLGCTRLAAEADRAWPLGRLDAGEAGMPEEVDALATRDGDGRIAVLVWRHADDQYLADKLEAEVEVTLRGLAPEATSARVRHYRIDAYHSNSHAIWRDLGAPQDPTREQLRTIEERQGLETVEPDRVERIDAGALTLTVRMPLPAVSLLEVTPRY